MGDVEEDDGKRRYDFFCVIREASLGLYTDAMCNPLAR